LEDNDLNNGDDNKGKKESVWDYPRPPRVEKTSKHIKVIFAGKVIAETNRAHRVLETSHPPTYYIPPEDVCFDYLSLTNGQSVCEYKGLASYYNLKVDQRSSKNAAWSYPTPNTGYEVLKDHLAFYPNKVDECYVDGEKVISQRGDFYGGWITSDIVGPFKGPRGTEGW
jgi:uncharacterized protein (DUF427 family)